MSKAFVVTEGEYSDYHILGVFSTKEKAEEFSTRRQAEIEEYTLDTWTPHQGKFTLTFDSNGNITKENDEPDFDPPDPLSIDSWAFSPDEVMVEINRADRELAIKMASEHRMQIMNRMDKATELFNANSDSFKAISPEYKFGFIWKLAKVLAGADAMPNDGSVESNEIRKMLGADK